MEKWMAMNFNTFNGLDGVKTCIIMPICWEIISLWFYIKIYRIDGVRPNHLLNLTSTRPNVFGLGTLPSTSVAGFNQRQNQCSRLSALPNPSRLGQVSSRHNTRGFAHCQSQSWVGLVSISPNARGLTHCQS
jgi:hypothetical protein